MIMKISEAIELNKMYNSNVPDEVLDVLNVPVEERWLIKDINSLEAIREGLNQSRAGATKTIDLGKFSQYAEIDIEGEDNG